MRSILLKLLRHLIVLSGIVVVYAHAVAPSFEVILSDTAPGEIKAIVQDRQGYMWFGGRNALLRYNAYKYQNIQAVEKKGAESKSVSPYYVTDIFQDSAGVLWVTSHSGLYYFDSDQEILRRPKTPSGATDPLFLGALQDIEELPSGELIVGGDGAGLAIFDKKTFEVNWRQVDVQAAPQAAAAILERTIQRLFVDTKNRIWVANNNGLNLFDPVTKIFSLNVPNPGNPGSKIDNALITLAEDKLGNILGGTLGKGLYIFNPQTQQFRHYINDPNNPLSLPDDAIWKILVDSENTIWLSHTRAGFSQFNEADETFTRFDYTYGQPGALAYGATRSLYVDDNRNIWIGHYPAKVSFHDRSGEAISIYRKNPDNPDAMSDNNVQRVMEDQQHNIWMAVGDGVNVLDRKTEKVKRYNEKLANYPARGSLSGYVDRQNTVWIGTWTEGFSRLNRTLDRFESLPAKAGLAASAEKQSAVLNDATVWGFCETHDNTFWLGTHYAGVNRFDVNAGLFTQYRSENSDTSLANNIVWTCYEDKKGRFWLGTANGLSVMNRETETFKNYKPQENNPNSLKAGSVEDIYEDAKGRLWFSTSSGLHLYREASDDFEVFTTENGFDNNGIRALTGDAAGDLWLGTNNGIIQFNPDTGRVKNYVISAGKKIGGVNAGAALTSASGAIIFGTTDGLVVIDAPRLRTNTKPPPVVLTDFKLFARSISPKDPDSVLKKAINRTDSIVLDYAKQMFSFEFAALNFRDADKNRYAYKLEGFDQDWREIGAAREAQYTNLSSGEYVFKVRASNNDGVWSENPKTIALIQLPPPWKTWWAYSIYACLGLLCVAYFVYIQKRKQRLVEEQNRVLEMKVAERTRDLAEKNRDIQALLSNMRQGLFSIQEGCVVHHEYSTFLETIFETKAIAGRDVLSLLFEHATLGEDRVSQIGASLFSIIGADILNYELNSDLLIDEFVLSLSGGVKIISLDWSPMVDADDNVSKLMVSVRDVTQLKVLEREASVKKRELDIVAQLLSISLHTYSHYFESATRYICEGQQLVEQAHVFDSVVMSKLFRNMHTVKGNSRAHGFSYVANAAHEAESFYDEALNLPIEEVREKLLLDLKAVTNVLEEYNQIYTQVLHRDERALADGSGLWMSKALLGELQTKVDAVRPLAPGPYKAIMGVINQLFSAPLSEILKPIIESLPTIAHELGKLPPQVLINDPGIHVRQSAQGVLCDIFNHLLRNAIDHGIETAPMRLAHDKLPYGLITIGLKLSDTDLCIQVFDNGRGLNLNRLYEKGLDTGVFKRELSVSRLDVGNIIFTPGLSTKQGLDTISGRGVGMDAVKQFLVELGGDINIIMDDPDQPYAPVDAQLGVNFVLSISLPREKTILA